MLKYVAVIGSLLIVILLVGGSFRFLKGACSSDGLIKIQSVTEPNRTNNNSESAEASQQNTAPQGNEAKPTATFNLRVTESGEAQGKYYASESNRNDGEWVHKFVCDTKIGEFAIAAFTLFLVAFTALLWLSTHRLWKVTSETLKHAETSARHQLRAYVSLDTYDQQRKIVGEIGGCAFTPIWKNTGETPALDVEIWSLHEIVAVAKFHEPVFETGTPTTPPATMSKGLPVLGKGRFVPQTSLLDAHDGRCRIFFWAYAEYSDVIVRTERHVTEVCFELHVAKTDDGRELRFNLLVYGPQNRAT